MYIGGDIKIPMRSDTSFTEGNIIYTLDLDTPVELHQALENGWSKIKYKGKEGWVISRYLTNKTPEQFHNQIAEQALVSSQKSANMYRDRADKYKQELKLAKGQLVQQALKASKVDSQMLVINKLELKVEKLNSNNELLSDELYQANKTNSSMHTTDFMTIVSTITLLLGLALGFVVSRANNRPNDMYRI